MDFNLPEHVVMLRDSLARFIDQHMPREAAKKWDAANHFPKDVFAKLAELGVMGLTIPEQYGGSGRDILATLIVIEELSRRSLAVSIPYIMAACYAGMNIVECGSEAQKSNLLPKIAAGELMFAYGWTEPDVGAVLPASRRQACATATRWSLTARNGSAQGPTYATTFTRSCAPTATRHAITIYRWCSFRRPRKELRSS
jgi:acyl-CoA dehydrogenase